MQEVYDDLKWEKDYGKRELKENFLASIDRQDAIFKALYIPDGSNQVSEPIYAPSKCVDSFVSHPLAITLSVHKGVPVDTNRSVFKVSQIKYVYIHSI